MLSRFLKGLPLCQETRHANRLREGPGDDMITKKRCEKWRGRKNKIHIPGIYSSMYTVE